MRRRLKAHGLLLLTLLAFAVPARAQRTTGEIVGTVTDESNAEVARLSSLNLKSI